MMADDNTLRSQASKIPEITLKGKSVYRLYAPAVIRDLREKFLGRDTGSITGSSVESSVVVGSQGSTSSWKVEAKHASSGKETEFYLEVTSKTDLELVLQYRVSVFDKSLTIMGERTTYEKKITGRSNRMFLGCVGDDYVISDWLENSNHLYAYANVHFKILSGSPSPLEKPADHFPAGLKAEIENPACSDFVLVGSDGEEKRVKTHKMILSTISPVFRAMLATDCQEVRDGMCKIEDAEAETIKATLNCALGYMVVERMDCELVQKVFRLADKYQVEPLRQHCIAELVRCINMRTVLDILTVADQHSVVELKNEAFIFLEDNLEKVTMNDLASRLMEMGKELSRDLYRYDEWRAHMRIRINGVVNPKRPLEGSSDSGSEDGSDNKHQKQ